VETVRENIDWYQAQQTFHDHWLEEGLTGLAGADHEKSETNQPGDLARHTIRDRLMIEVLGAGKYLRQDEWLFNPSGD